MEIIPSPLFLSEDENSKRQQKGEEKGWTFFLFVHVKSKNTVI
jgi:hypothetical protein